VTVGFDAYSEPSMLKVTKIVILFNTRFVWVGLGTIHSVAKVPLKIIQSRNITAPSDKREIFFNENLFLQNCERVLSNLAK